MSDSDNRSDGRDEGAVVSDPRGTPAFFEYWNQMDFVTWMGARAGKIQE
jgi:hypothetical protein